MQDAISSAIAKGTWEHKTAWCFQEGEVAENDTDQKPERPDHEMTCTNH